MVLRSRRSKRGTPAHRSDGKQRRSNSSTDDAFWHWPLAFRGPIEVYDEYIDEVIRLAPGQRDPGKVEGLLLDFRYVSRDHEVSRRSLLCW